MNAPVALFIYNRPEHTAMVVEALQKNLLASETDLFVFADGPKAEASDEEKSKIKEARAIVSSLKGFRKVTLSFSENNKGLVTSLINGINSVLEIHEQIIVLEDDILTSKYFLSFCNEGLQKYKDEESVMTISGFAFPLKSNEEQSYFIQLGSCWGWTTWKRAWKHFSLDAAKMLQEINSKNLAYAFDVSGTNPYTEMLKLQSEGKINSWGVCWYASVFLRNGLMLCPAETLTINVGMDGSGTHNKTAQLGLTIQKDFFAKDRKWRYPDQIVMSEKFHRKLENYFRRQNRPLLKQQVKNFLSIIFKRHR
jgi:hypothetical protein